MIDEVTRAKRLALVIPHLGPGGAQRVVATAANAFAERGIDTHVITILGNHADAYSLHPNLCRHQITPTEDNDIKGPISETGRQKTSKSSRGGLSLRHLRDALRGPLTAAHFGVTMAARARLLRRVIRTIEPDAILSFLTQTNILTIFATRGLALRTIVSERNDLRLQQPRLRVQLLRKLTYRWADVVTANTFGTLEAMESFVPKPSLAFLPNPLPSPNGSSSVIFAAPTFIALTRLVEQKGVDVIVKAAAEAFRLLPEWRLAIVGDGPLRDELMLLAYQLGIDDRVDWHGHVDNPIAFLKAADVFILTSRFEGSPNALLEAMACGLPSIISDASPGPLELVGTEAALTVPADDVSATARAMIKLAQDQELRDRLGAAALSRTRIHQLDNAMQVWRDLLRI